MCTEILSKQGIYSSNSVTPWSDLHSRTFINNCLVWINSMFFFNIWFQYDASIFYFLRNICLNGWFVEVLHHILYTYTEIPLEVISEALLSEWEFEPDTFYLVPSPIINTQAGRESLLLNTLSVFAELLIGGILLMFLITCYLQFCRIQ